MRAAADLTRQNKTPNRVPPPPPPQQPQSQQPQQQNDSTTSVPNTTSASGTILPPPPTLRLSPIPASNKSTAVVGNQGGGSVAIPPPPAAPHSSHALLPQLPSAPPSGNLASLSTTTILPPPPPPPPKRATPTPPISPSHAAATSSNSQSNLTVPPTTATLPPPPPPPAGAVKVNSLGTFLQAAPVPKTTTASRNLDEETVQMSNTSPQKESAVELSATLAKPQENAQKVLRLPPTQPEPLPYTAFVKLGGSMGHPASPSSSAAASAMPPLLARRQETFTVLVIATEAAHQMAWKNNLLLTDMLNGLMHQVTTTPQNNHATPLAPFRSCTKALTLQWSDLPVKFVLAENHHAAMPDDQAQSVLHQSVALQEADGNLNQELDLLEDQVDHLLLPVHAQQENNSNQKGDQLSWSASTEEDSGSLMNWYESRQRQLDQVTKDAYSLTSPLTLPWLRRYRYALDHTTSLAPHDLSAVPALCLSVCTTSELNNPIETLRALEVPHYLPPQFHKGLWNPQQLSRHVLVLHDQVEGPKDWDETALRQSLTLSFGPTAALLRINTIAPETATKLAQEETQDLWQGGGQCGNCLSVSDRVTLRKYLAGMVTTGLLPALERRIAQLNAIVSERKKGVRNVLKSFWRTGKSDQETTTTEVGDASVRYRYDSIESQTRLLADTLFLIKDFDQALGTYRLIRDDYKQDKAHAHYASCQEMMALCLQFLDPYGRARDIFSCIETALLSYKKAAEEERAANNTLYPNKSAPGQRSSVSPISTKCATRLCLVMITSKQVCMGRSLEVADLLASASSNETALGAAVLLEQASAHYFNDEKFRKYSFHMLMSGHMFRTAEQEHHAFRCFTSALHIYRDAQWDELHNHIRSALAAQLYSMGRMALSLQLYAKLVGCRNAPRVSVKSQQKFVNHVLEICNEHSKKAMVGSDRMVYPISTRRDRLERIAQVIKFTKTALRVLELPNMQLPFIDDETVHVIAEEGGLSGRGGGTEDENAIGIETATTLGRNGRGDPDVWNQLELESVAELRSCQKNRSDAKDTGNNNSKNDQVVTKVLSKIKDIDIRNTVAEMDKEKAQRNLVERAKKSSTYKATPPVRALMEPLAVEFSVRNPLGVPIDLVDLQVVARMKNLEGTVCTNEDAIQITPLASKNERQNWTFHSSTLEFTVPHFCRLSQPSDDPDRQKWKSAMEVDPFFVVTKASLTLEADSLRTISASVCPLVEGDIEILGIRCRLFDMVWIFHPFSLKGELLQNTQSNRANRVRAESLLLKAKVERGMPCLTADLVQPMTSSTTKFADSAPLLQGQVSKWNLRLSNVGTAPAKSITLKTNLPWVTIWDGGDQNRTNKSPEELERQATSYSVGPSGTFLRIPIDGFGLMVDGEIQPGETVEVAVDLRTSGAGRQDFYMLFRYELVERTNAVIPCRWLRKMFEVPLYPSLTLNASLIPSYAMQGEHIMSVEITNYRSDRPDHLNLLISKISLASRAYELELLPGQIEKEEDGKSVLKLGWQERVTLHYRVIPLEEENSTCLLSQSNTSNTNSSVSTEASLSSLLNFLCLERAHSQFQDTLLSHQRALARAHAAQDSDDQHPMSISDVRRANTGASSSNLTDVDLNNDSNIPVAPTSIHKLIPPDQSLAHGILVCGWANEEGTVEGQHHIRGLPIRPFGHNSNGCPIVVTGKHPSVVSNNFEQGPATVSFEVTLQNRLVSHKVDFEFSLEQPGHFDLTGPESFRYSLTGGETLRIPLKAILPSAGVYNIQKIRLTIDHEPEPVSYMFPLQWNVTVKT